MAARFGAPIEDEHAPGLRFTGRDGQHFVLTRERPVALLHYSAQDWPTARRFYEEVLRVGDVPTPAPGHGEVRVRLAASGVNPSDVKARPFR